MWLDIFWLVLGLILILEGANLLVDGASSLARRLGLSDLTIGLTVVAFGTSAPELAISLFSALSGNAPLAVGNVVGSNIFNILMIIGITSLIRPIKIERNVLVGEMPMMVLSAIILWAVCSTGILDGNAPIITRVNGILLLIFLLLFIRYTFATTQSLTTAQKADDPETIQAAKIKTKPMWKSLLFIIIGLAGLIWGGDRFVEGASGLARIMGISDAIIGLTIVAVGTSLPELATSIAAALKGNPGIAVGNVIGSNILNVLCVLGLTALIRPLPIGDISQLDLFVLLGASLLFWIFARWYKDKTITRIEGCLLTSGYMAYIIYLIISL